jgi:hypothetical protein
MKNHLLAIGIGMCMGGVIGLMMHSILFGIAIGAALGVAYDRRNRRSI